MVRLTITVDEAAWRRLRDWAEDERITGKASVSGLVARVIQDALKKRGLQQQRREAQL